MNSMSVSLKPRAGVEGLLRPVLEIIARSGPIEARDIARQLSEQGLLGEASRQDVNNIGSETGQTVVVATINLKEAGLIESTGPATWRITRAGGRQLEKEESITFSVLRRRPKFQQYLKGLEDVKRRRNWQELRFDYYVGGRILALQGSAHAAPAALAYAIEYSLKAALGELPSGVTRDLLYSHDLGELHRACLDRNLLEDTYLSDDFLRYAQHHFERRYPKGQRDLLKERRHWTFGTGFLHTYDDCIIQLDRGLDRIYGSSEWSLGNRALKFPGGELSRAFFHGNTFALARLDSYLGSLEEREISYPERDHLARPDLLFAASENLPYPGVTFERAKGLLDLDLVALFVYPEDGIPHPDPARVFLPHRLPGAPQTYEWALRKLREEFGTTAVEAAEDRDRNIWIHVYDRRAKEYCARLPVTRDHLPLMGRTGLAEIQLDKWISATKRRFAAARREGRLPPGPASGED